MKKAQGGEDKFWGQIIICKHINPALRNVVNEKGGRRGRRKRRRG